jgi:hypothetical protein
MSSRFDKVGDFLLSLVGGFERTHGRPTDDPFTTRLKGLERSFIASFAYVFIALAVGFGVANVMETFAAVNPILAIAVDNARDVVAFLIFGAIGLTSLNVAYSYFALYFFIKKTFRD